MRKVGVVIVLTVLSFVFALGFGEFALRAADPSKMRSGWTNAWELNFAKGGYSEANQLGFRGKPIEISDGDFVVALVGDSQVECLSCPDRHLPEDALQQSLSEATGRRNVKVFGLGVSGYGADQELLALKSFFSKGYRADLVLVWQTLGNDVWNAVFPSASTRFGVGRLKPTFRLENGKLIWPSHEVGAYFCDYYIQCIYRIQRYGSIDGYWEQFLPPAAAPLADAPPSGAPIVETDEAMDREKSHWSIWIEPSSPRKRYGIELTRALYDEMRVESQRHGARFALFDVDRYTDVGVAEARKFPYFRRGQQYVKFKDKFYFSGGRDAYMASSRALNEGFDLIMVDMDTPDHMVSPDDSHLNESGNARVMEQVAARLASRGLLGK